MSVVLMALGPEPETTRPATDPPVVVVAAGAPAELPSMGVAVAPLETLAGGRLAVPGPPLIGPEPAGAPAEGDGAIVAAPESLLCGVPTSSRVERIGTV